MQASKPADSLRGTETILLVEDDAAVRHGIRRVLQWAGYQVVAASHAGEAVELTADPSVPIQLLLTDITLPGVSGGELAAVLQGYRPELRVILMSGYSAEELPAGETCADAAFLQKPFATEALLLQVREILHPRQRRSDAVGYE
jgi:two-component system, cell cycle sensor histidine kinase and response regulator CckA